jgi:hypothetical protein
MARTRTLLPHEETDGRQLVGREAVKFKIGVRDQGEFIFHKRLGVDFALPRGAFDESNRHAVTEKKLYDFLSVAAVKRKLNPRIFANERTDEPRQHILGDSGGNSQGKLSLQST